MPVLHVIYASTSGHTEHVVRLVESIVTVEPGWTVILKRAETATAEDLTAPDALVLASGTWNTGGIEGQLNMHMHALLHERAADADLAEKPVAVISLGDERFYFRVRCTEHFLRFIREHGGSSLHTPLILVNEPYDQTERIEKWGRSLAASLRALAPSPAAR